MRFDDEYVFNNGMYDITVRNLKASFFDILSFSDSLEYNSEKDFSDKLANLKVKMNDIIGSVKELDSYKKVENNNTLFIKTDTVKNSSVDVPLIDYGESSAVSEKTNVIETQGNVNDIESSIDDVVNNIEESNNINMVDEEIAIADANIVQNSEADNSILSFKKNNDDVVKAILVSDIQYNKLNDSKKTQIELLNQINFFEDNILKEESGNQDVDSSENLTEKAVMLYKQGKTKEAQEIMDKINSMNHVN